MHNEIPCVIETVCSVCGTPMGIQEVTEENFEQTPGEIKSQLTLHPNRTELFGAQVLPQLRVKVIYKPCFKCR